RSFKELPYRNLKCTGEFAVIVEAVHDEFIIVVYFKMGEAEDIDPSAVVQFKTDTEFTVPAAADCALAEHNLDVSHEHPCVEYFLIHMGGVHAARHFNVDIYFLSLVSDQYSFYFFAIDLFHK